MNYDTYYDQRLLALESLIYKNESTDIYKKTEKSYRMTVAEAKEIKKAYSKKLIKSTLNWHLVFIEDFIKHDGWVSMTLKDYADRLTDFKTKDGGKITGNAISVFITEIRSRYGLLAFKTPKMQRTYIDRIRDFSLKEWDFILSRCIRIDYIVCVYRCYLYGWDIKYIDSKIGRDHFKSFLCRSLGILSQQYPKKNAKIEK